MCDVPKPLCLGLLEYVVDVLTNWSSLSQLSIWGYTQAWLSSALG